MSKDRRIAPRKIYAMNGTSPRKPRIVTRSKLSECVTPALQAVRHAFNPLARKPERLPANRGTLVPGWLNDDHLGHTANQASPLA
jgi:hypothetical protein